VVACADSRRPVAGESAVSETARGPSEASNPRSSAPPGGEFAPRTPDADARSTADSATVSVKGPTVVAFEPALTQAQLDSSEQLATVLGDFEHYLSEASDSLEVLGFALVQRPTGPIRLLEASGSREVRPSSDSSYVGYVFVAPGRRPRVYYGVKTDGQLLAAARMFLAADST